MSKTTFKEISAADFFYRNREIAGFTNPTRAIFAAIREVVENSLDAAESLKIPPDIYVRLSYQDQTDRENEVYKLRVEDNGIGVPPKHIPSAFGQVLFGSKYKPRQQRGTFGLGGKMAILYGQITTHRPAQIISSTGESKIYAYKLMIDIKRNRPLILDRKVRVNKKGWRGTVVEFTLEGHYSRAMPKILEYFKQTAMANPYANLTFVDPRGRLYKFSRVTEKMPDPPEETLPHPYGVDVELLQRLIEVTPHPNMHDFLKNHFHRVGEITAKKFLKFGDIDPSKNPKNLSHQEIVKLMRKMKKFDSFLAPDASCLSPLGEDLLRAGVQKELNPEFLAVEQRSPSAYAGHPFIVEVAIAYGGDIPKEESFLIYRFANKIPLLYDEASDVSVKVINSINWRRYKVKPDKPIALAVHICSTKIPYKTVGKEFIADRPEVEREIANGLRAAARRLKRFLTKREHVKKKRKRINIFNKYLPKIARFSTQLAGKEEKPDIEKLLNRM
ncbi:MAG: DNA topoisomerase VI subunit B [Thermoproteota archaeon]